MKLEQHSFPARHFFPQERFFSALGFLTRLLWRFKDSEGYFTELEKEEQKRLAQVLVSHH